MTPTTELSRRTALKALSSAAVAATFATGPNGHSRADAAETRVLPTGTMPPDKRLGELKDLNGYFPWEPSASPAAWEARAEYVRRQILVACGLWPMPARPPVEPTVTKKIERDGYTVEGVVFESHPGLYVTGSLYRPTSGSGKRPGVLCPHGHWQNGRFHDHGGDKLKLELESKAEVFEVGGRHPLQARCVQLARMGCVVFLYDMLGYGDNHILSFELIHGFAKQRPDLSAPDHWGLFSAQSELRLLNALGLQTWNSIRALDWLETLPDVDAARIGVTGASGGGTQTFILGAVDPRPVAFFPAVMVSTAMQGGCTCENATYLRVDTGNIEFAALLAPRTLGLTGAQDWTVDIETKGLPQLRKHYEALGAADKLTGKFYPYEHNYNHPSRRLMYEVFQTGLGLGPDVSVEERDYVPLAKEEATVWTAEHPMPTSDVAAELKIVQSFATEFAGQLEALAPSDAETLKEYRRVVGGGWDVLVGRRLANVGKLAAEETLDVAENGYRRLGGLVKNETYGEAVPFLSLVPDGWNQQVVLWVTDDGKQGLFDAQGAPRAEVAGLLHRGYAVAAGDLLYQGEFLADGHPLTESRRVKNPREFLGYTAGYNHPLPAQRTHDVMTLAMAAKHHPSQPTAVHLIGRGMGAVYAAAAAVQLGDLVTNLVVEPEGFTFASLTEIRDPRLWPGAVRYGDVPGLLALRAPHALTVVQSEPIRDPVGLAYLAAGQTGRVTKATSLMEAIKGWT